MKIMKIVIPFYFSASFFLCSFIINADVAFAATHPSICYVQEKDCLNSVKDSANEIDRDLCRQSTRECVAKCLEEARAEEVLLQKERILREQEEKDAWDKQGLTAEEQFQIKLKREQEKQDQRDAAEKAEEEKGEQERLRLIDEDNQREHDK
jgi:hypothetical protein